MTPTVIVIVPEPSLAWQTTRRAVWEEDGRVRTLDAATEKQLRVALRARFGDQVKIRRLDELVNSEWEQFLEPEKER